MQQLSQALSEIHRRKEGTILHRDIKPANIFLDSTDSLKLGDFGFSKVLNPEDPFAYTKLENAYYTSPDHLEGIYTEKTDIYALGCLLYELCLLSPPPRREEGVRKGEEGKRKDEEGGRMWEGGMEKIRRHFSGELARVVRWCMSLDMKERPNVEDLMNLPQISMRIREKRLKENSLLVKRREEEVGGREEKVRMREEQISDREGRMKDEEEELERKLKSLLERKSLTRKRALTLKDEGGGRRKEEGGRRREEEGGRRREEGGGRRKEEDSIREGEGRREEEGGVDAGRRKEEGWRKIEEEETRKMEGTWEEDGKWKRGFKTMDLRKYGEGGFMKEFIKVGAIGTSFR